MRAWVESTSPGIGWPSYLHWRNPIFTSVPSSSTMVTDLAVLFFAFAYCAVSLYWRVTATSMVRPWRMMPLGSLSPRTWSLAASLLMPYSQAVQKVARTPSMYTVESCHMKGTPSLRVVASVLARLAKVALDARPSTVISTGLSTLHFAVSLEILQPLNQCWRLSISLKMENVRSSVATPVP